MRYDKLFLVKIRDIKWLIFHVRSKLFLLNVWFLFNTVRLIWILNYISKNLLFLLSNIPHFLKEKVFVSIRYHW